MSNANRPHAHRCTRRVAPQSGPSTGGASFAGVEIGEQHAMGAVLGKPGGDRPNRAMWVRETLQNAYSTDYLRKQSAGLFRSHVPHDTVNCDDLPLARCVYP
jgi:hypothetical protein